MAAHFFLPPLLLAFLIVERYTKTEPKRTDNFGFGWTVYTKRKVSYRFRLCLNITRTRTLDTRYTKTERKRIENFVFGWTVYTKRKVSYRFRL